MKNKQIENRGVRAECIVRGIVSGCKQPRGKIVALIGTVLAPVLFGMSHVESSALLPENLREADLTRPHVTNTYS